MSNCGPRLTASLIYSDNVARHRVVAAFTKKLIGITITDTIDLEDKEGPMPQKEWNSMDPSLTGNAFSWKIIVRPLLSPSITDCLIAYPAQDLVQSLVNVIMRWVVGSQPTFIRLENAMHRLILLGIAHLRSLKTIDPNTNHPAYIDEQPVVSLFKKRTWTRRQTWITDSLATAHNLLSVGFILEELMLLFMEKFGGKYTALGDVFYLADSSCLSRKVTLVSLRRTADDLMEYCQVDWNTGSSDRFGYKASKPADVVTFLNDPIGMPILFPDARMGPDFVCFFKQEETGELIILVGQDKVTSTLSRASQNLLR